MTAITYTAKRNIEESGYKVTADANISASLAGSPQVSQFVSNNSPATDLSVFTDGYYLLASGFTNEANNEWFNISGTPTVTAVTLDSDFNPVVTEAYGNDITLTEYVRGYGVSYNLETGSQIVTMPNDEGINRVAVSLSGKRETIFYRREVVYNVRTGVIEGANLAQWREFFASVMGGEVFTFDAYGTIAVPDDPVQAYLNGTGFQIARIENFEQYFITFSVIVSQ